MSVENKVLAKLQSQEWTTSSELEKLFPPGEEGHFSWPQRLRGLRDKGFIVTRRIKTGTKNLSEWSLELPEPSQPQTQEPAAQATRISERQAFEDRTGQMAFLQV